LQKTGRRFVSLGKDNLLFQPPAQSGRGFEEWGVGSSKHFEICGVLKKESRSTGRTSHQVDPHDYLLEVKIEIPEQMPDWINNNSV
jgi:hypothetical protein